MLPDDAERSGRWAVVAPKRYLQTLMENQIRLEYCPFNILTDLKHRKARESPSIRSALYLEHEPLQWANQNRLSDHYAVDKTVGPATPVSGRQAPSLNFSEHLTASETIVYAGRAGIQPVRCNQQGIRDASDPPDECPSADWRAGW
jgi:hypothetical protein